MIGTERTDIESGVGYVLCASPVSLDLVGGPQLVGCKKCLNCRLNLRREWTARILLEGFGTQEAGGHVTWSTLTYAPENLPYIGRGSAENSVSSLNPLDYQLCWKRLRQRLGAFRFFIVGEYGERATERPHYHALFFGPEPGAVEKALQDAWESAFGHTRTRPWNAPEGDYSGRPSKDVATARAAYVAHYVTKKMDAVDDPRLRSRHPEFVRMSRRPGIGMVKKVLALHYTRGTSLLIAETGDVARTIRIGGSTWPLSKTVRSWLRTELDIPEAKRDREELLTPTEAGREEPTAEDYLRAEAAQIKLARRVGASRTL